MYSMVSMWEEGSFSSHQAEEYESLKMIKLHQGVLLRHMCNGNRSVGALWALTSGPPAWTPDPPAQPARVRDASSHRKRATASSTTTLEWGRPQVALSE